MNSTSLSNVILRLQRHLSHAKPLTGQNTKNFRGKKVAKNETFSCDWTLVFCLVINICSVVQTNRTFAWLFLYRTYRCTKKDNRWDSVSPWQKSNSSSHYLMNEVAKIDFEKWNAYKKFLERLQNHATNDLIDAMWH